MALLLAGFLGIARAAEEESSVLEPRAVLLEQLRRLLPRSPAWEAWLERTGELPPDFDRLPARPGLPDALLGENGTPVRRPAEWPARRRELLELFAHYVTGTVPPPPDHVRVMEREEHQEAGAMTERVVLGFGPDERARLHLEVIRPKQPGPRPVFLTQDNHRRWALIAVSRGYLGVVYAGADSNDDTGAWVNLWPGYDWTKLTRRAWAASRCIDYLVGRADVDARRIALTGHSRNGKTSLIAAALDERIAAVISSSSGAGGACTYRLFSEVQFGEGIELITRQFPDWLHPRLRFFVGREHKLPVDQHELIACIAPRPCLISTALNDAVESVWAVERTAEAARPVYALWGATNNLALRYRDGGHPTRAEDIESYLDWLDDQWDRPSPSGRNGPRRKPRSRGEASPTPTRFQASRPIYPTYQDWQRWSGERIDPLRFPPRDDGEVLRATNGAPLTNLADWEAARAEIRRRVEWGLGTPPPVGVSVAGDYGAESRPTAVLLNRGNVPATAVRESLNFGNYIAGDLYLPTNVVGTTRRLPVLVWVHPLSVSGGYVPGYFRGEPPHSMLTHSGYAVFAFDQIGCGARIGEVRDFYRRYPRWSLMGKQVADLRAAVDALQQHARIEPGQIFLVGYAAGGLTALHAAALDERVAGVITVGGFMPFRADTVEQGTGGVARWSYWLPWLPRLGAFIGHEARIPYDLPDLLRLVAPRTALIITPGIDSQAVLPEVERGVAAARATYNFLGHAESLVLQRTSDYNHFSPDLIWCLCGVETIR